MNETKKLMVWGLTVYLLSWGCYLPMLLDQTGIALSPWLLGLKYAFVLTPAAASAAVLLREKRIKDCWLGHLKRLCPGELAFSLLVGFFGVLITVAYSYMTKIQKFNQTYSSIGGLAGTCLYLFATGLAEELAWRGFFFSRLTSGCRMVKAALVTGLVWSGWHIPMWTIRNGLGLAELVPLFLWTLLAALLLCWYYARFQNLISAALLHMLLNVCWLAPAGWNIIPLALLALAVLLKKIPASR